MSDEYADILIRVGSWDEEIGAYPVEATVDDGSFFGGGELRLDRQALLIAELDPQEYGLELFYALFSGPIRRAYDKATGRAEAQTGGRLRVRLWIDDKAAELHALPWERLYHIQRGQSIPLATSGLTPFSRYTGLDIPEPQPITTRPIRLLIAISNPRDLPPELGPIEVEREVENLYQALGDLRRSGQAWTERSERLQVTLMPGRSGLSARLRGQLEGQGYQIADGPTSLDHIQRLMPGYHVLHYLGHGIFQRRGERGEGTAALYLEDEDGGWVAVTDDDLVPRLTAGDPLPHLIFLSTCESARREAEAEHPFVGLGPKLVKAGVPAVVAMQDVVPADLARQLEGDFYRYLLEHGVVDRALNQARLLLFERETADWAIPVLFMRLKKGQLFAADPVRMALQAIYAYPPFHPWAENQYLPLEAIHLPGRQATDSLEWMEQARAPSLDLVEAILGLFFRRGDPCGRPALDAGRGGQPRTEQSQCLIALVGAHGMAKSTHLRRMAWITAQRSLQPDADRLIIPVYVDLRSYPTVRTGPGNPIETLILESLQPFWPTLTSSDLAGLLRGDGRPGLRVLLDGSDDLPDRQRREAWRAVQNLVRTYPQHEYMIAVDPAYFDPRRLEVTDLLVIQPLSQRKIEGFLKGLDHPAGPRLYRALSRGQLFDLAAWPWLLVRMLKRAQEGIYPRSRSEVLQNLVEEAIADIPAEHGMQSRAEQTLYTLAWEMQSARSSTWAVSDAFRVMAAVRGNREYNLEALYDELVSQGLLARVGQEALRFAYPPIQAYCCARAILGMEARDQLLDDITATLGRLTRLRWWEDTLILLSGLMRNPNVLIRMIVYGANLTEGEQVFLAARCLLESSEQRIAPDLIDQVVDALVWRLDSANERRISRRVRAAEALGQLRHPSVIPYLVRVANQPIRANWRGEPDYEFSSVRMAAALALQRMMMPRAFKDIQAADPQLAEVLRLWDDWDVEGLSAYLHSEDVGIQAIAAFALGDLRTPQAVELLISAFLDPDTEAQTRWAVTDALALLDPALVTRRAILPLLDAEAAEREGLDPRTWKRRADWYERLAYLIGKTGAQAPAARAFLDRCLYEFKRVWLKGYAIESLGWLYERSHKGLFEAIAMGDFSKIAVRDELPPEEAMYLRYKALEALAYIGDRDTLTRLRESRIGWDPELQRAFYWTSEEIFTRMS